MKIFRNGSTDKHLLRRSAAIGPYVDFFWRYGFMALALMAFVSVYRMGDVLALNLSKPMIKELGYSLTQIGRADSYVALAASIAGVGIGGWLATRWPPITTVPRPVPRALPRWRRSCRGKKGTAPRPAHTRCTPCSPRAT